MQYALKYLLPKDLFKIPTVPTNCKFTDVYTGKKKTFKKNKRKEAKRLARKK